MKSVHVITMWSGGKAAKKWQSEGAPEKLPTGTGVSFVSLETRLRVEVIGSISVEEYESGRAELEMALRGEDAAAPNRDGDRLY